MTIEIRDIEQDDSLTRAQVLAIGAGNGDHIFRTSDTNEWLFLHDDGTVSELGSGDNIAPIEENLKLLNAATKLYAGSYGLLGDSVMFGYPSGTTNDPSVFLSSLTGGAAVNNYAISGSTSRGVVETQLMNALGQMYFDFDDDEFPAFNLGNGDITLSTDNPQTGTYSLRVTHNGQASPRAQFRILDVSTEYDFVISARGDGTAVPIMFFDVVGTEWTGTSSTNWQDAEFTTTTDSGTGGVDIKFMMSGGTAGNWIELDVMLVKKTDQSGIVTGDVITGVGINDTKDVSGSPNISLAESQKGINHIAGQIHYSGWLAHILSITPWSAASNYVEAFNTPLNDWIKAGSSDMDTVTDTDSLGDASYALLTQYNLDDTHLNDAGAEKYASLMFAGAMLTAPPAESDASAGRLYGVEIKEQPLDIDTLGPQKLTNGSLTAWTTDDPDDWTVTESGGANVVTEVAGGANILSDGTLVDMFQTALTSGLDYRVTIEVNDVTLGSIDVLASGTVINISEIGKYTVDFTATATSFVIRRNGACDVTVRSVLVQQVLEGKAVNKKLELKHVANLLLDSEAYTTASTVWDNDAVLINADTKIMSPVINPDTGEQVPYQGIVGTSVSSSSHRFTQTLEFTGKTTIGFWSRARAKAWLYALITNASRAFYADIENGAFGTLGTDIESTAVIKDGDDTLFLIEVTRTATGDLQIYPAVADGNKTYTGDDVSSDILIQGVFMVPYSIADYIGYIKTGATPNTGESFWQPVDETAQAYRQRLGLYERLEDGFKTGVFETPQSGSDYVNLGASGTFANVTVVNGKVISGT